LHSAGWFVTDISGQVIGPIFMGQAIQDAFDMLTLEDGPITCPKMSGTNQPCCATAQQSENLKS
jgi:hypothetical protein